MDFIKLGMAVAEYEDACRVIDAEAGDATGQSLKSAWSALLDDDTDTRDRLCDRSEDVAEAAATAKVEAGLRIAEKYGLDRDAIEAAMARKFSIQ